MWRKNRLRYSYHHPERRVPLPVYRTSTNQTGLFYKITQFFSLTSFPFLCLSILEIFLCVFDLLRIRAHCMGQLLCLFYLFPTRIHGMATHEKVLNDVIENINAWAHKIHFECSILIILMDKCKIYVVPKSIDFFLDCIEISSKWFMNLFANWNPTHLKSSTNLKTHDF